MKEKYTLFNDLELCVNFQFFNSSLKEMLNVKIFGKVFYEIGTFFIYAKFGIADTANSAFFQFNTVVYKSYYVCEMDQNTFWYICM